MNTEAHLRACGRKALLSAAIALSCVGCERKTDSPRLPADVSLHLSAAPIPTPPRPISANSDADALAIGMHVATELGYKPEAMRPDVTRDKGPWGGGVLQPDSSEYDRALSKKLEGKDYWAVYFEPRGEGRKGGDVAVFVEFGSGAILGVYRGK